MKKKFLADMAMPKSSAKEDGEMLDAPAEGDADEEPADEEGDDFEAPPGEDAEAEADGDGEPDVLMCDASDDELMQEAERRGMRVTPPKGKKSKAPASDVEEFDFE